MTDHPPTEGPVISSAAVQLAPDLWCLPTGAANAYLWRDRAGLAVLDPGLPGEEHVALDAVAELGGTPGDVTRIVLTHWHADHSGAAAALAARTGAEVLAGAPDAAVLRGAAPATPPDLTDDERPLHDAIAAAPGVELAPPRIPAVRDLHDGDGLGSDGGAVVRLVGGHTDGSIAVWLPAPRAVLTGDVARSTPDGSIAFGLFHVDRPRARRAITTLSALAPAVAGFGHGPPATSSVSSGLRHAAAE